MKDKDTLYGEIDYRNDKSLSDICRFKKGSEIKEYAPFEIEVYRFKDDRLFISKEIDQKKVFLEVLIKGKLDVFTFSEILGKPRYFVSNDEYSLREITYIEKEVVIDGKDYLKSLNNHVAVLNIFTSDAPSMRSKINAIQEPRRNNLIKLAKTYHNRVCDTEKCIIYESEPRKIKILTELRFGLKSYSNVIIDGFNLTKKHFFTTDALIYFSIPKLGDDWYFKTGLSISKIEYYKSRSGFGEEDEFALQIPLELHYIKSKGVLRPKLSLGVGYSNLKEVVLGSSNSNWNILTGLGVNIKISKKMFVSVNSEFDFGSTYVDVVFNSDHYKLFSASLTAGLVYQF
ncbi:MAG: hypothetical protein ABJH82_05645 [Polaribacter sp.]|uniref:hypothetical protein n=1 Tax=Polaribacter sp. TaxID=1920175 RepID=UPI0032632C83